MCAMCVCVCGKYSPKSNAPVASCPSRGCPQGKDEEVRLGVCGMYVCVCLCVCVYVYVCMLCVRMVSVVCVRVCGVCGVYGVLSVWYVCGSGAAHGQFVNSNYTSQDNPLVPQVLSICCYFLFFEERSEGRKNKLRITCRATTRKLNENKQAILYHTRMKSEEACGLASKRCHHALDRKPMMNHRKHIRVR
jgi:hypothetical protein